MINILPKKEKDNLKHEYLTRLIIVILIFISTLCIITSLILIPSYQYSISKEKTAEANLELFNKNNPQININELNDEISATNERLSFLISKKPQYSIVDSIIETLLSVRTSGISFNHISYSNNENGIAPINIMGVARDRTSLHDFNNALSKNELFSSVDLPISNFVKPNNINYNLSLFLK